MKRLIQLTFWLPLTAVILAATMLPQTATAEKKVRYVKATGTGDGSSWDNASNDLQKMINESDPNSDDEIWVFAGTYKPIHTASGWRYDPNDNANNNFPAADGGRDNAFVLKAGVKIYGGF
ncbi:MAG: hypothetical protein LBS42_05195, partial [Tannerella sp.]|nr:hypothetical protein [Tannerella sp.]